MNFQEIILKLEEFWAAQNCILQQPYDVEKGAGTMNPATFLRTLGPEPWNVAYVEPSRRPTDGRYGENPNRLYQHHQFQVIMKPSPDNIQDLYLESLRALGIDPLEHDIRFVEDNWESPTLGAWGLGWEVWLDGMEVTQFTYFQQVGGLDARPVAAEITYGLERLAMFIQKKDNVFAVEWVGALPTAMSSTSSRWSTPATTLKSPTRKRSSCCLIPTSAPPKGSSRRSWFFRPTITSSSARTPLTSWMPGGDQRDRKDKFHRAGPRAGPRVRPGLCGPTRETGLPTP